MSPCSTKIRLVSLMKPHAAYLDWSSDEKLHSILCLTLGNTAIDSICFLKLFSCMVYIFLETAPNPAYSHKKYGKEIHFINKL